MLRHSGATRVFVDLTRDGPGTAVLSITDNGVGFDPESRSAGMGLANMRDRAEELPGGRFSVARANGHGTKVEVACSTSAALPRS